LCSILFFPFFFSSGSSRPSAYSERNIGGCGGLMPLAPRAPDEWLGCASDPRFRDAVRGALDATPVFSDQLAPVFHYPSPDNGAAVSAVSTLAWSAADDVPADCVPCAACASEPPDGGAPGDGGRASPASVYSGAVYDLSFVVGDEIVWRVVTTLDGYNIPLSLMEKLNGQVVTVIARHLRLIAGKPPEGPFRPDDYYFFIAGCS
jgi:hypothetical protein